MPFYRCEIPGCDMENSTDFLPDWLNNSVPFKDNKPAKCDRYIRSFNKSIPENCSSDNFQYDHTETCSSFVFKTDEVSILKDVSKKLNFYNQNKNMIINVT